MYKIAFVCVCDVDAFVSVFVQKHAYIHTQISVKLPVTTRTGSVTIQLSSVQISGCINLGLDKDSFEPMLHDAAPSQKQLQVLLMSLMRFSECRAKRMGGLFQRHVMSLLLLLLFVLALAFIVCTFIVFAAIEVIVSLWLLYP